MQIIRLALLALLAFAIGLGVPGGVAQGKKTTGKSSKKKTAATGKASTATGHHASGTSSTIRKSPGKPAADKIAKAHTSSRKGSSRSRRQPGQKAPSSDRIMEIQTALAKSGAYQGMPSGKWDDETTLALRKFQAAHGVNPTGRIDAISLQRLGLGSQTAGVAAPTPPPGAVSRLSTTVTSLPSEDANSPR